MTVYYKATRPDGTDFRTGTLRARVGETVQHSTSKRFSDMEPNLPSTYLSLSVEPGEVLIGGSWPCRMFRVKPVGRTVKRTDGQYPYKRGCRAYRVVEECPAWLAFGPNGEQVVALLERTKRLTATEAKKLDAAWGAAWGAAWDAAWGAAWGAAWDAVRGAAWDAVRDAAWDAARGVAWGAARDAVRDAAWDAVRDAVRALLAQDLISPEHFDVLYGPWREVFG